MGSVQSILEVLEIAHSTQVSALNTQPTHSVWVSVLYSIDLLIRSSNEVSSECAQFVEYVAETISRQPK